MTKLTTRTDLRQYLSNALCCYCMDHYTLGYEDFIEGMTTNLREFIGRSSDDITEEDLILAAEEFEAEYDIQEQEDGQTILVKRTKQ